MLNVLKEKPMKGFVHFFLFSFEFFFIIYYLSKKQKENFNSNSLGKIPLIYNLIPHTSYNDMQHQFYINQTFTLFLLHSNHNLFQKFSVI